MRLALLLAAVATSGLSEPVAAAPKPEPLQYLPALAGDYFPLASREVGRTFHIYVRYPEGYSDDPEKKWPIVYLLDGDSAFPLLSPAHLFIHYDDKVPDALIVGIAYGSFDPGTNRRHFDFTPPSGRADEGGAPTFERFLKNELIPSVENRVRADPSRRILVGQSRGGGFVIYSAFADPDLFWARIASSPTLQPGLSTYLADAPPARRHDLHLIAADGTKDEPEIRSSFVKWEKAWTGRQGPWALDIITIDGGTHAAGLVDVYRRALNILYPPPAR